MAAGYRGGRGEASRMPAREADPPSSSFRRARVSARLRNPPAAPRCGNTVDLPRGRSNSDAAIPCAARPRRRYARGDRSRFEEPQMTTPPPARVGDPVDAVDTPALVIDLDAFERNLDRMAAFSHETGIRVRPHAKTHKSPAVAHAQMARGAVGQCCQQVSAAEVLVSAGIVNVLVSNAIVGAGQVARPAGPARGAW